MAKGTLDENSSSSSSSSAAVVVVVIVAAAGTAATSRVVLNAEGTLEEISSESWGGVVPSSWGMVGLRRRVRRRVREKREKREGDRSGWVGVVAILVWW